MSEAPRFGTAGLSDSYRVRSFDPQAMAEYTVSFGLTAFEYQCGRGVRLGLDFPAGKAVDQLSRQAHKDLRFPVKLRELSFSLSGMENKMEQLVQGGADPADVARFTLNVVCDTVAKVTERAMERHPGLPVLCSGGVASNAQLREMLTRRCSALFAQPQYSTDNAMGTAILTWRALERQEGRL